MRLLKQTCHILCTNFPRTVTFQTRQILLNDALLLGLVFLDLGVYPRLYIEVVEDVTEGKLALKGLRSEGIL